MKKIRILSGKISANNDENYSKNNTDNSYKNSYEISVKIANTFTKRLVGLMFRKDIKNPLLFEIPKSKNKNRSTIHTCFMRFEIAIVFIGFEGEIFEIATLKPWQYYTPKKPAKYIIEFKKQDFKKYHLEVNDKIKIS